MDFDLEIIQCFCDEASDAIQSWESVCFELARGPAPEHYQTLFRIAHNLKGGSRAVGLTDFGNFIHHVEDGITLLRDGKITLNDDLLTLLLEAQRLMSEWIHAARQDPTATKAVDSCLARFAAACHGQATPSLPISEKEVPTSNATPAQAKSAPEATVATPAASPSRNATETIRVSAQKIDSLIQIIGELSIQQSIVAHAKNSFLQHVDKLFVNSVSLSQKLTKELYETALSLRMQPVQSVFQRLERNVLDLSKSLGKVVDVEISGGDVELDKAVLEQMVDPLTHIVRNAIDHGIEPESDRQTKGKPIRGRIKISAKKDAFGVEIEIRDDGKGLRAQRIREKAIEKGLVGPNDELSTAQVFNLILLPGFSTAEKITEVSGRGVGMDVVKQALEALGGTIRIESQEDQGSAFLINLPTSVSIIDVLLTKVGGQNYAVPLSQVEEVITSMSKDQSSGTMVWHDQSVLPVGPLESVLDPRAKSAATSATAKRSALKCSHRGHSIGFLVDEIGEQQQVVIRELNPNIDGAFGVLGGTVLANGEPGLILDIPALVDEFVKRTGHNKEAA